MPDWLQASAANELQPLLPVPATITAHRFDKLELVLPRCIDVSCQACLWYSPLWGDLLTE